LVQLRRFLLVVVVRLVLRQALLVVRVQRQVSLLSQPLAVVAVAHLAGVVVMG
jgi:hypothetical protein